MAHHEAEIVLEMCFQKVMPAFLMHERITSTSSWVTFNHFLSASSPLSHKPLISLPVSTVVKCLLTRGPQSLDLTLLNVSFILYQYLPPCLFTISSLSFFSTPLFSLCLVQIGLDTPAMTCPLALGLQVFIHHHIQLLQP